MEALSNALTNKFLHAPTQALNQVQADEREALLEVIHRLYQLHSSE
jgi:glutamyl-tRNA reductase